MAVHCLRRAFPIEAKVAPQTCGRVEERGPHRQFGFRVEVQWIQDTHLKFH